MANTTDPAIEGRIKDAKAYIARMRDDPKEGDGMKQLAEKAKREEHLRNTAFHSYHIYEYAVGAIEIGIVLASVSVVTRIGMFGIVSAVIGIAAAVTGLATAFHVI